MSDPQPDRLKKRPTRAEPLQPDRPGSGDDQLDPADPAAQHDEISRSAKQQKEQTDAAIKNVSEGYD